MSKGWELAGMPSQAGRRAVVTGGNSGVGYPVALELARRGAEVVIATRSSARGEDAVARVRRAVPEAKVEFSELDLASLTSVHAFAARELAHGTPLDLLINNAGISGASRRAETVDGFELVFATNVLGHFALTGLLWPALLRTAEDQAREPPRVVAVASLAHRSGRLHFADLQYQHGYASLKSYGQSKLANLMLAFELDRRLRADGVRLLSVAAHPGIARTNIFEAGDFGSLERAMRRGFAQAIGALLNTAEVGALPTLYAATAAEAAGGGYYGPQGWFECRGAHVGAATVAPHARDAAAAAKLWARCEQLTGVAFPDVARGAPA